MLIATHNGPFHADDVLGVAMLKLLHTEQCSIVRTRDEAQLATAGYVVDVGGVHDPVAGRFDHHQKGRAGARPNGILYSAAGLVWAHHGPAIVDRFVYHQFGKDSDAAAIAARVDAVLVAPICATDNGQELLDATSRFEGVRPYSISALLGSYNPSWTEAADFDLRFAMAVEVARQVLLREIIGAHGLLAAKDSVEAAVRTSPAGVLVLDRFVPWQEHLGTETTHQYAIFPNPEGTWMCQAVPAEKAAAASFKSKRLLPEAWAGLRDEELARVTGVPTAVFCHPGRFICGAVTKDGALELARAALAGGAS